MHGARSPRAVPWGPEALVERLAAGGPALVALSGGVDSGVVAALAGEALGSSAIAVTLTGPAVSARETEEAAELARAVGIRHLMVEADPLAVEQYRANRADRCFYCRSVEASVLQGVGRPRGVAQYLDGVHLDDLGDDRPGIRALDDAGFVHPLVWARWGKADVRGEARRRNLPNRDRPSNACLASRVARGEPITAPLLQRIDAAETLLVDRGFHHVRVRVSAGAARIEVDPQEVARLEEAPLADQLVGEIRALGFLSVRVDPRGYRGGPLELPVVR